MSQALKNREKKALLAFLVSSKVGGVSFAVGTCCEVYQLLKEYLIST